MEKLTAFFLGLCMMCLSGCATVFGSWGNSLVFENESGESAEVFLDGKKIGNAPGKIKLEARQIQQGSQLEIRADGQPTQEFVILRRVNAGYVLLNVAATAGVGMAVDVGTGYIYRPTPRKFTYDFKKDR